MSMLTKIIAGTAFAAVLILSTAEGTQASDVVTMKPLQGVSFDVNSKRAVSYFLKDAGICKVVLTVAEEPNLDEVTNFTATRFEAAIEAGKSVKLSVAEGKSLEFACHADAQLMSVTGLEQIASSPGR